MLYTYLISDVSNFTANLRFTSFTHYPGPLQAFDISSTAAAQLHINVPDNDLTLICPRLRQICSRNPAAASE